MHPVNAFTRELGSCWFANQSKIWGFFMQSVWCCEMHKKEPEGIGMICLSLIKRPKSMGKGQNIRVKVGQEAPSCLPPFWGFSEGSPNRVGAVGTLKRIWRRAQRGTGSWNSIFLHPDLPRTMLLSSQVVSPLNLVPSSHPPLGGQCHAGTKIKWRLRTFKWRLKIRNKEWVKSHE